MISTPGGEGKALTVIDELVPMVKFEAGNIKEALFDIDAGSAVIKFVPGMTMFCKTLCDDKDDDDDATDDEFVAISPRPEPP